MSYQDDYDSDESDIGFHRGDTIGDPDRPVLPRKAVSLLIGLLNGYRTAYKIFLRGSAEDHAIVVTNDLDRNITVYDVNGDVGDFLRTDEIPTTDFMELMQDHGFRIFTGYTESQYSDTLTHQCYGNANKTFRALTSTR